MSSLNHEHASTHEPVLWPNLQPEVKDSAEKPTEVVERFINFTKNVFADGSRDIDIEWEHEMNTLYGNEELERTTKNQKYRGVAGIKDDLLEAYVSGGLIQLKATFMVRASEHTRVSELGDLTINAFIGVIDFN